jgi:hypothetical protein
VAAIFQTRANQQEQIKKKIKREQIKKKMNHGHFFKKKKTKK